MHTKYLHTGSELTNQMQEESSDQLEGGGTSSITIIIVYFKTWVMIGRGMKSVHFEFNLWLGKVGW